MPRTISIGVVGAGFAADFHLAGYRRVVGVTPRLAGLASRTPARAEALAQRYGVERVYPSVDALLADAEIDAVDLCVPVHLHHQMALAAARAGKHVICEKPLIGYAGPGTSGSTPKHQMYDSIRRQLDELQAAFAGSGCQFCYAENWVYAPVVRRAAELILASGGTVLEIQGYEGHSGSHSEFSKRWETSGGGALMRLGIHPLTAAIYLKRLEGEARRGQPIAVREVLGQTANLADAPGFAAPRPGRLVDGWVDVENWATGLLTFDDGAVAVITASDVCLGGITDHLEVCLSNARLRCRIEPNDACQAFAPDIDTFAGQALNEKLESTAGWSFPAVDVTWSSGHLQELQDFVEAIAACRPPLAGLDLAVEAVRATYALYVSAEEGRRIRI